MTESDIANLALGKIGGAGDADSATAFIGSINGTDKVSTACKRFLPVCRRLVIAELAVLKTPFRETAKFKDLGTELDTDVETGQYVYVFNLPGDFLSMSMQFDETRMSERHNQNYQYRFDVVANAAQDGYLLLTNDLSNYNSTGQQDSAFIEYAFDLKKTGAWSEGMVDCIATRLAAMLVPIVGAGISVRQLMMQEYKLVAIPFAQSFSQAQSNNSARTIPNFLGGRNSTLRGLTV